MDMDMCCDIVNLDEAVPIPAQARKLNWLHILEHVPLDKKETVRHWILEDYLDLFIDGDHQVVLDKTRECLRFKENDPLSGNPIEQAKAWLKVSMAREDRTLSLAEYRQCARDIGYSLDAFFDLHMAGTHVQFMRTLNKDGSGVCKKHCPVWMLQ